MALTHTRQLSRSRQIYALGLPIIFGQFSQSLTSLIDTAMVAALNDSAALAAVAIGSYASFLACALVLGFSVGVQTLVARRLGENRLEQMISPLNAAIHLATLTGLLLTAIFYIAAPTLMSLLNSEAAVNGIAVEYFRYRCLSIAALGFGFACRGYWNGIKQSTIVMWILVTVQASNILLSYSFIYGAAGFPKLDAPGSGLGSTISVVIGALLYAWITFKQRWKLLTVLPSKKTYRSIIKLGLPNSGQHFLVALAMSLFYFLLGKIGVNELAVGHALINIALFIVLPAHGFGTAATTLVSQAIGKKEYRDAYLWGWHTLACALPFLIALSLPLLLFPNAIIGIFVPQQAILYELVSTPLQLTSLMVLLQAVGIVLSQALLGAGDNHRVFVYFSLIQWLFFLPSTTIAVYTFNADLSTIWAILLMDRLLQAILFIRLWKRKQWGQYKL